MLCSTPVRSNGQAQQQEHLLYRHCVHFPRQLLVFEIKWSTVVRFNELFVQFYDVIMNLNMNKM
jgi:hypothetical protein